MLTVPASFGADQTVRVLLRVARTHVGACRTDVGADPQEVSSDPVETAGRARQHGRRGAAGFGAVEIEPHTADQALHPILPQTCIRACLTDLRTDETRIDAGRQLFSRLARGHGRGMAAEYRRHPGIHENHPLRTALSMRLPMTGAVMRKESKTLNPPSASQTPIGPTMR
ncbi:hypothetical protein GCM10017667_01870 [Streptomyces filamentosus]|uniref:Uncharacterized protein n=1 Tax=Streptomyces filamentosus TaxID=67294 RepID=A0A919BBY5_STRFL|nr:hypothetical protein GCM10017667_01870 [Streptomyces filamentosus]